MAWHEVRSQKAHVGQRRARQHPATPRATSEAKVGGRRATGHHSAICEEIRNKSADRARNLSICFGFAARQKRATQCRMPQDRSKPREVSHAARRTAISQAARLGPRRGRHPRATPRATGEKGIRATACGRANTLKWEPCLNGDCLEHLALVIGILHVLE